MFYPTCFFNNETATICHLKVSRTLVKAVYVSCLVQLLRLHILSWYRKKSKITILIIFTFFSSWSGPKTLNAYHPNRNEFLTF